jgi:hypothetical protein
MLASGMPTGCFEKMPNKARILRKKILDLELTPSARLKYEMAKGE